VYAKLDAAAGGCSFYFRSDAPEWSAGKGGWYIDNDRAIVAFNYVSGKYTYKVILDSRNVIENLPVTVAKPSPASAQTVAGTRPLAEQMKTLIDNIAHLFSSKANAENPTFTGEAKITYNPGNSASSTTDRIAVVPSTNLAATTNLPVGTYVSVALSTDKNYERNEAVRVVLANESAGYPNVYSQGAYRVSSTGGTALDGTWRLSGTSLARRVL
jgi:hypothetical protein